MNYLDFLEKSEYSQKIIDYLKMDVERVKTSNSNCLFTNLEFPLNKPYLFFEPRVAMIKPTRYYQNLTIDGELKRLDWMGGSTRALGFSKEGIIFVSKSVLKDIGEEERLDYYIAVKLNKEDLSINEENNMLTISLNKEFSGRNIKTGLNETHRIEFNFNFLNNERAIMPKHMAEKSMYGRSSISQTSQIISKFENYTITVLHFAPHPLLIQHYKELGFEGPIDFQRNCFSILKQLIGV